MRHPLLDAPTQDAISVLALDFKRGIEMRVYGFIHGYYNVALFYTFIVGRDSVLGWLMGWVVGCCGLPAASWLAGWLLVVAAAD